MSTTLEPGWTESLARIRDKVVETLRTAERWLASWLLGVSAAEAAVALARQERRLTGIALDRLRVVAARRLRWARWKAGGAALVVRGLVMRPDVIWASGLVVGGWVISLLAPLRTTVEIFGTLLCLLGLIGLTFPAYCFWKVVDYLKSTAEFEDLRSGVEPGLSGRTSAPVKALILKYPFSAVVLFSLAAGLVWSWNFVPIGASLRHNLAEVVVAVPYVDQVLDGLRNRLPDGSIIERLFPGESDQRALIAAPWAWRILLLKVVYLLLILALGSAWAGRFRERRKFAEGLIVKLDAMSCRSTMMPSPRERWSPSGLGESAPTALAISRIN